MQMLSGHSKHFILEPSHRCVDPAWELAQRSQQGSGDDAHFVGRWAGEYLGFFMFGLFHCLEALPSP